MRYEVRHYTFCEGWVNNAEDEDGNPVTFATAEEAQASIDDFFSEIESQIASGEREPDAGYGREEFAVCVVGEPYKESRRENPCLSE